MFLPLKNLPFKQAQTYKFFNNINTATKNYKNALYKNAPFFLSCNGNGATRLCVMRPTLSPPKDNNGALLLATTVR